ARVGAAGGSYSVVQPDAVALGRSEDFYWRYETFLKTRESDLGSTIGAHGQLHAIRRELYPFPSAGTINDDYVIPLSVVARGYRAVYDPRAVSYEPAHEMTGFGRRVRIARGNIQQLREIRTLLWPLRPLPLLFFISHKVLRLVVPFAMVAALVTNALLLDRPLYRILFAGQVAFYLIAAAGAGRRLRPRILGIPSYFTMINAAVFVALAQALFRRRTAWK
ncbi:MAG: glycosyltransferase family 2 protein, partial [Gemmatimonadales bacterium]